MADWPQQGRRLIYHNVLAADSAAGGSIDSGPIIPTDPSQFRLLELFAQIRTDAAGAQANVDVTLNGDTSAIYDNQRLLSNNAAVSGGDQPAQNFWQLSVHGGGGSAGYSGPIWLIIPGYCDTTFWKDALQLTGPIDATAGNALVVIRALGWRSATAINQLTLKAEGTEKLKAGSYIDVYVN